MNTHRASIQQKEAKATSVVGILLVVATLAVVIIGGMQAYDFVQSLTDQMNAPHKSH